MADRRHMEFAADEVNTSEARRFVLSAVDDWGIPRREDVALFTSELVSNALEHASHPVTVAVERHPERLRLEVSDGSAILPIVRELSRARPRGRGMFLVQELTSDWGAEASPDGGKTVWVEFELAHEV